MNTRKSRGYARSGPKGSARRAAGKRRQTTPAGWLRRLWRWSWRGGVVAVGLVIGWVALLNVVDPPRGLFMRQEAARLDGITQHWVGWDGIAPVMARAVVAAEDANFCRHWGFDMAAIRQALDAGAGRGASTISQQVVKNVFLWPGRSWARKALEALLTPLVETLWSKRRILEVYLNVAEFGTGVFGVEAAAAHHFKTSAARLTPEQAARLAMVLPNPKARDAARPTAAQRRRVRAILDGAATIAADGRDDCFAGGAG